MCCCFSFAAAVKLLIVCIVTEQSAWGNFLLWCLQCWLQLPSTVAMGMMLMSKFSRWCELLWYFMCIIVYSICECVSSFNKTNFSCTKTSLPLSNAGHDSRCSCWDSCSQGQDNINDKICILTVPWWYIFWSLKTRLTSSFEKGTRWDDFCFFTGNSWSSGWQNQDTGDKSEWVEWGGGHSEARIWCSDGSSASLWRCYGSYKTLPQKTKRFFSQLCLWQWWICGLRQSDQLRYSLWMLCFVSGLLLSGVPS